MSTIFYAEPELVIALNKKVIFVNPDDLQIFKDVELPEDLTKCGLKTDNVDDKQEGGGEEQQQKECNNPKELQSPIIQDVSLSPHRQLLAITTAVQKALLLYQCRPENAKLVSVRPLARASSALAFNSDGSLLLVTDKTGDCYQYDCIDLEAKPRLLFGHLSIVYDILWTPDTKFIVTCDRDDKIRVTNFPDTFDIHGYCLGHKEFVAGLVLLQDHVIASVSGDKTLRLWNFDQNEELAKIELPAPGIRLAVRVSDAGNKYQAAVLLHQPNECIGIYEVEHSESGWTIKESSVLSFPSLIVSNLCFAKERLFVAGVVEDNFKLQVANITGVPPAPVNWLEMVDEQFKDDIWKVDDVSNWFKKRYDNVSDYLERKRRRIEEKQK